MIRSTHIAITLLLLVPHLTRAGSQQSATFGQEDYAQLEGVVRDAVTGVGIGGVSVQLFGTNSSSTTTDQEGRFAFEELKPGDVAMFATKYRILPFRPVLASGCAFGHPRARSDACR